MKRTRLSLRTRLALVYGALFFVAGGIMLGLTWLLMQGQLIITESTVFFSADTVDPDMIVPDFGADDLDQIVNAAQGEILKAFVTQGAIALVIVGALAISIGWLIAGRALRPLAMITATARRIADAPDADRRMHERIGLTGKPDELTELADTFDGMLARLDTSFDAQRRFIANASHELRTPLTLNRTLLEVSTHRADASEDVRLLGSTLLEINARHERLIEGLLLLARSERELAERRFVDLADLVAHVADEATAGVGDTAAEFDLDLGEAPTSGDTVLLEQLVRNLLDNALKYNIADGGWVRLRTHSDAAGAAVLVVSNSGPVVPTYELGSLFEPFRRLDGERIANSRGVGLGLSIVHAIVHAHGGRVELAARPDGGMVVTVALPGETYEAVPEVE